MYFNRSVTACAFLLVSCYLSISPAVQAAEKKGEKETEKTKSAAPPPKDYGDVVKVTITTSMGPVRIELFKEMAPGTVENFLAYAKSGHYNKTIFHRVIPNFMVQGGGFDAKLKEKETKSPIKNESENRLKNDRGTIAMARTVEPHSATSQFFINLIDNNFLNYQSESKPGYAVFGRVTEGLDVIDRIAKIKTKQMEQHEAVPLKPVFIESVKIHN